MNVKLLTKQHLEFLSLKGGCTGSPEYIHVKMPHCWKSCVAAHFSPRNSEEHSCRVLYLRPKVCWFETHQKHCVVCLSKILYHLLSTRSTYRKIVLLWLKIVKHQHFNINSPGCALKETKSATMNIFRNFYFLFKSFVKVELSYVFKINLFNIAEDCTEK